ncbi:uncharacterized protein AB675_6275 [Cyphellophora attinorum]|uniref:Uncharacterized protein n=1 Tax=Cyphellophora attinorum TaxID=1664694 RepID=A0A0N0NQY1_9EURO|nr:uncharacterized protein AB675_6275 [Phialophora attinorum]KPI44199.1 hypothetical protein AB675_6275 [Phialophora attinorum]
MVGFRDIISRPRWLGLFIVSLIVIFSAYKTLPRLNDSGELAFPVAGSSNSFSINLANQKYVKPKNVKVIGLVFFGRRDRRNLVANGGWIDEVHWVLNTGKKPDLAYLEEILAGEPAYKKIDLSDEGIGFEGYGHAWGHVERGAYYIKIDDDVVYFADDAVPRVVSLKLQHPEFLVTSANVINSPLMGWVHYHSGAMHPYLPEFDKWEPPLLDYGSKISWKYTDYPSWAGPEDYFWDWDQDPPYHGHRWLRLTRDGAMRQTPASKIEYDTWGRGLKSWGIAAQEHYSFLENLLDNRLDKYKLNKAWITDYQRLSINFICVYADDVLDNLPMDTVDEEWLTVNLPKKLGKSVAVETDALAAHFTFGTQGKMQDTDLLGRYKDYAMENACRRKVDLHAEKTS